MSGTARKSVGKLRPGVVKSLAKASYQGSLPGTFFHPPTLCPSNPSPHVLRETGSAAEGPGL